MYVKLIFGKIKGIRTKISRMENNMKTINIRTDLAVEAREQFEGTHTEVSGVMLEEKSILGGTINVTRVKILNQRGEKAMKKPVGNYITIESDKLKYTDEEHGKEMSKVLSKIIEKLIPAGHKKKKILIVGLGNRDATPDALGPMVISGININDSIYAVSPGVMGQTGMETASFVMALSKELKPDAIIAVDALAARNTKRLNTTIQISDTGISPGSGVGNHRQEISKKTLGIPVIAIGVPTVVDAATIVNDAMDSLIGALSQSKAFAGLKKSMEGLTAGEKFMLIKELLEPAGGDMYVTPKDIDENVKNLSFIISEAINMAVHSIE